MNVSRTSLGGALLLSGLIMTACGGDDPTAPTGATSTSGSSAPSGASSSAGGLYDETVLRTIDLEFAQSDWWSQLQQNDAAEENIPADLTVEDVLYPDVGVRFKGQTSDLNTGDSLKKSFNIEIDDTHAGQRVMGYRTLNLNNAYSDPTFVREVLYFNVARRYIPTARANFVVLRINGENWGVYANIQQINTDFIEEWFPSSDGTRWRAGDTQGGFGGGPGGGFPGGGPGGGFPGGGPGGGLPPGGEPGGGPPPGGEPGGGFPPGEDPGGGLPPGGGPGGGFGGGTSALTWLGDDQASYAAAYDVRTNDTPEGWAGLMAACNVLNNTALDQLAGQVSQVLDVEESLWYLAVENAFADEDGYLFKGADYYLYWEVETGLLHPIQHDGNEVLGGSARLGPTSWTPTQGDADASRPLISRLLAVSAFRESYLSHLRTLVYEALDLSVLEPKIEEYRALIRDEVMADDKKLYSNAAFESGIEDLKSFIEARRSYLLARPELN